MRRIFTVWWIVSLLGSGCARVESVAIPAAARDGLRPQLIKTQTSFATSLPGLGSPLVRIAEDLSEASGGRIQVKIYEPGELVGPNEILNVVSTGKVHAGYSAAGFWSGKMPAAPLFSAMPFGPEAGEYVAWLYFGNGRKLYQEMYDQGGYDVHVIPCALNAPETSGWFAHEIRTQEDLQGLKMRFFGLGGEVMQRMGVATSLLSGSEIFPALERGAIDATEFSMPAIDERIGFHRLVKYNYFPGWHQQATILELLINKDKWNSLDAESRAMIELTCRAQMMESFAHGEAIQARAIRANVEQHGVQIKTWSPAMLAAFKAEWEQVASEHAQSDRFFSKVWLDLSEFRAEYRVWKKHAFLPRE